MARTIDVSKSLSPEDIQYLKDRGRWPLKGAVAAQAYGALKHSELRAELEKRGLYAEGNKSAMIARLEADDRE